MPRHIKSDYLFYNDKNAEPYQDIKRAFNDALKKAGIEDFILHSLRHTFASWMVMKGASLKAVQELLGHTDIKTTMRYAHLSEDYKKNAVELLDKDFNENDTQTTINSRLKFSSLKNVINTERSLNSCPV